MAVYTHPPDLALASFLDDYALGPVLELTGIRDGIENSNFYLTTPQGRHVLTIFERMPGADLDWCLSLMDFLAARGIPCATPAHATTGGIAGTLCGKPAAVFSRLDGASEKTPDLAACAALGSLLARMHLAGRDFVLPRADPRGREWRVATAALLAPQLDQPLLALLEGELACQHESRLARLPAGPIHADLFRDNVLFAGGQVSGVIDFYYGCQGPLLHDLAVSTVDWCLLGSASAARCVSVNPTSDTRGTRAVANCLARDGPAFLSVALAGRTDAKIRSADLAEGSGRPAASHAAWAG